MGFNKPKIYSGSLKPEIASRELVSGQEALSLMLNMEANGIVTSQGTPVDPPLHPVDSIITHPTLTINLEAYYSFDTNGTDLTGHGHDTAPETSPIIVAGGIRNNCAELGPAGGWCYLPNFSEMPSWAVSAWIKGDPAVGWEVWGSAIVSKKYDFPFYNSGAYLITATGNLPSVGDTGAGGPLYLTIDQWYHVVWMVENGVGATVVVDNDWSSRYFTSNTKELQVYNPGGLLSMGWDVQSSRSFNGWIDELAIYSRVLLEAEINSLNNSGVSLPYS